MVARCLVDTQSVIPGYLLKNCRNRQSMYYNWCFALYLCRFGRGCAELYQVTFQTTFSLHCPKVMQDIRGTNYTDVWKYIYYARSFLNRKIYLKTGGGNVHNNCSSLLKGRPYLYPVCLLIHFYRKCMLTSYAELILACCTVNTSTIHSELKGFTECPQLAKIHIIFWEM